MSYRECDSEPFCNETAERVKELERENDLLRSRAGIWMRLAGLHEHQLRVLSAEMRELGFSMTAAEIDESISKHIVEAYREPEALQQGDAPK